MIIKSYSNKLSKNEIKQCIDLLIDRYKNLDVKIEVFGGRLHLWLYNLIHSRETTKDSVADFNLSHNSIRIFVHKYGKDEYLKLQLINSLYHELRHKYQSVYIKDKYINENYNYIPSGDGYADQWIEKDARNFAKVIMNNHIDILSKIVKCKNDWSVS